MASERLFRVSVKLAADLARNVPAAAAYVARMIGDAARHAPSASGGEYAVDVLTSDADLAALEEDWSRLHAISGARGPFSTWPWLYAWWMEIARRAGAELHLVTVRHGGRLAGIGPFYVDQDGGGARVLRLLGDTLVGSEYLDVLADPAHEGLVIDLVACALRSARGADAICLNDLAAGSHFARALSERPGGLIGFELQVQHRMPCVKLGQPFEQYASQLSSSMRYNFRRKEKKLKSRYPAARLAVLEREDEIPEALELLFRLHGARWSMKGMPGNFARSEVQAFHHRVCPRLLAGGTLRLYRLDLGGGETAAILYCLRSGKDEFYLQAGMNPRYEDLSSGFCLMKLVIERCADEGVREFDMLRGTEAYKSHWVNAERQTVSLRFARPTPRGALWISQKKLRDETVKMVKDNMPGEMLEDVRGIARRLAPRGDSEIIRPR